MNIEGKVVKGVGGVFTVSAAGENLICHAPKKIRYADNDILVGDEVIVTKLQDNKGVIEKVLPRKNRLIRPQVANLDMVCIVAAHLPPTDFMLIDKVLINCVAQGIEAVIVLNKCDQSNAEFGERIIKNYDLVASKILSVSAHKGTGINALKDILKGTVCFAGQSGVGKTSLLNALMPTYGGLTGDISRKINRGKNTTRHTELLTMGNGVYLCDTPGFSLIELSEIPSSSLRDYYPDFLRYTCRFSTCTHTAEPNCSVKEAVQNGEIQQERYDRYLDLFAEIKELEKNRY